MIFRSMYGVYLSLSFPEDKEAREERPRITDCLSMRCSGFFAQEPLGAIFLQSTVTGKIPIAVFVVGVTKIWEKILSHLMDMPDFKWLLIDSTYWLIHMLPVQKEAMRRWDAQKGAQHQDTSGRGCAWYAGQNHYYRRYRCRYSTGIPSC